MSLKQTLIVIGNRVSTRLWSSCVRVGLVRYDDTKLLREITDGETWETFWQKFSGDLSNRFFFSARNKKEFFLNTLQSLQSYEEILDDANNAASRTFDLLGSGPVQLPTPINWNVDFRNGAEWEDAFYTSIGRANAIAGGDIKMPWELGRFHYVMWLGKGYWVSGSRRYVEAYRDLITEWIDANPMPYGVQWGNAMEVAIRACNWIAGIALFADAPGLTPEFWQRMLAALWKHAEFIEDNLEVTRRSGNHLIANYTGLVFIGALFKHTIEGERWVIEGVRGMEREIIRQTSADGVNYEKSIAYHRFVAEMAMDVMLLCKHLRMPFRADAEKVVEKMCAFTMHYARRDASVPNIGDNDNGRLFRVRSPENVLDHRALLSTAAVVFDRPDFKTAAGAFAEETLWLCGAAGLERFRALYTTPPLQSQAFPEGGFYVMRSSAMQCIVDAGELGKHGWGGHGHNDTLSFELWCGEPMIVDRGTFCYTSDRAMRDRFRGTAAHNTAMIDNAEIATFAGAFKVEADHTNPTIRTWKSDEHRDVLEAAHYAYARLADPVTHIRRFQLDKDANALTIVDTFDCKGQHHVRLALHLAPGVRCSIVDGAVHIAGAQSKMVITSSHPMFIEDCEVSPSYGVKLASLRIICQATIAGTSTIETRIARESA